MTNGAEPSGTRNQVFAAPPDDPRARRPADAVELVTALIVLLLLAWAYRSNTDVDRRVLEFLSGDLPGWLSGTFTIVFIIPGLYAVGLIIGIAFFGHGRHALVRDMVLAVALTLLASAGAAGLTGPEWPDILPELLERDGFPSYPVVRLSTVVAVLFVAHPYLSLPMRKVGRRLMWAMAIAAVVMSYGTVSAVLGAVALGAAAAATIHLVFGSGVGIPSKARILDGLQSIGLDAIEVEYLDDQPVGATLLGGSVADDTAVQVKVYGRDAADAATASRLWRQVWYLDDDRALTASGLQQAEHESLMLHEGREADLAVPELVGWGKSDTGDAFVVTRWLGGASLGDLEDADVDDATLGRCWRAVDELHDAGLVHRSIDRSRVVVGADRVILDDLAAAQSSTDSQSRAADVAQMLVATSVVVGSERAISAARAGLGDARLAEALPLLQGAALPSTLQADAKRQKLSLKDLRQSTADAIGADELELVQLERVSWKNLAMVVLTLVAAYGLISSLADIGFDTIAEEVADAEWAWLVTALVLAQLTNVGEWLVLTGLVPGRVPFGPTIQFRYALSFIDLAVPGDAGSIAMNVRYMQKLGVSPAGAVAQGPLVTVFSKGADILLLIISSRIIGQTVDLDDIDSGPVLRLLVLALVVIVIGVIVTFAVPKLRAKVLPHIRDGLSSVKESVTDPERLLRIAGGTLVQKILFAMTLAAAAAAYGQSIGFGEAIFVNSAVSLFVGLVPVPGGVGVGEAALTAGLVAVGVPEGPAVAAAISHRMVTNYIPPVYGWYASRWLTDRDYL